MHSPKIFPSAHIMTIAMTMPLDSSPTAAKTKTVFICIFITIGMTNCVHAFARKHQFETISDQ